MRIGMVLDGNYPSDIRVRKEAESLAKLHDVFVLCNQPQGSLAYEEINGVKVIRSIQYKSTSHRGIIDILTVVNFIHPFFKKELPKFIKKYNLQVLHVHDLPLAKTVLQAAKKHALKSVLDLHENYPAALLTWFSWRKSTVIRVKNKLFFNYNRWRRYESVMLKKYDVLVAVVEEMKERLLAQHSIREDKIVVVPNSEKKEFALNFEKNAPNYFADEKDRFIISYVGGFGPHRGLHTAIAGMKKIKEHIPNALLMLIGPSNKDTRAHLNSIIEENGVHNFVKIRGSVPFKEVTSIMINSAVNIIPHISNEHTESTMPHKFYQILLSQKPLLVSDCAPMKRIVEELHVGSYFKAGDSESFAQEVIRIAENYPEALKKSSQGYNETFNGNLNWEYMSKELLTLYDNLSH
jgi:glycosyltransferase involved in cell wall biosynthesis